MKTIAILKLNKLVLTILLVLIASCTYQQTSWYGGGAKVFVFSKTAGFRHSSIGDGRQALIQLGLEKGFRVVATEDANNFTLENLQQYSAVVFLNTTGDILDDAQQTAFEQYIQGGGGFVGIHSATDTEYDWPWYGKLVGASFNGHPEIQQAHLRVVDKDHPSTTSLEDGWQKTDEWYNFKAINPDINVLIEIDEQSYTGGTNGAEHPIAWYQEFDGGRAFYTAMGHTAQSYKNPVFLKHLLGGIAYAMGDDTLVEEMPAEIEFVRTVLDFNLNEPMELDEIPGEGILFIERRGAVKFYNFAEETTKTVAQVDIFYGNEDGLLGLAVDPNYKETHWIYLFYSAPGEVSRQRVARFDFVGDTLNLGSEKILLEFSSDRWCCHSGGGLEFGPDGLLYIGVGDNTNPFESDGYAPIDERQGRARWDAQRTASNSNDLRGKILRIKPEDDGSYAIPEGNLYPPGTPNTRPEVYVMGLRNPFRFSIDSKTGGLFWGDVGPDAGKGDSDRGPKGMGEFNRATRASNWGWPYTRGNNQAYNDYDFSTGQSGAKFDARHLRNDSPNNTGVDELPPAQESSVWYSYDKSQEFPWLGTGGVNPMAGPVFYASDFDGNATTFPHYFENSLFVYEWMRDWIYVVRFDSQRQRLRRAEPFMPASKFSHPMDMIFGSDGSMYLLEYGQRWNAQNMDARLNRISYQRGNTQVSAAVNPNELSDAVEVPEGRKLIEGSDCGACHGTEGIVNGPSYRQISEKYSNADMDYLVGRVISGGSGVWGERHMSPHPQLSTADVKKIVSYILLLEPANIPTKSVQPKQHGHLNPDTDEAGK